MPKPGKLTPEAAAQEGLNPDDVHQKKPRTVEVLLGAGRMLKVKMLTRADATAVANALHKPGVLEALSIIGRHEDLPPDIARLVRAMIGEP